MKHFINIVIILLVCLCFIPAEDVSRDVNEGVSEGVKVEDWDVIEDPEMVSDKLIWWEKIDDSETKIRPFWIVEEFAQDAENHCAAEIGGVYFVFEGPKPIYEIHVPTSGSKLCAFDHDLFIIYIVRGDKFYTFNLDNYEVRGFRLADRKDSSDVCNKMQSKPGDSNIQNGFYVSNILGNKIFTAGHDKLYYVKDGEAVNLYTTYIKVIFWGIELIVIAVTTVFFFLHFDKFIRKKKTNDDSWHDADISEGGTDGS